MNVATVFHATAVLFLSIAAGWTGIKVLDTLGITTFAPELRWVMIHLVTIGAAAQALFGSLPALAARHSPGGRVSPASRWMQWLFLNTGWMAALIGMTGKSPILVATGAVLVMVAVILLTRSVGRILASREGRTSPVAPYYKAAPVFFLIGLLMAMSMRLNWWAPGGYFGMLEAHVHANVWGFLALIAAGSLYLLMPGLTGNKLAKPQWIRPTYWLLLVGVSGLVAGPWLEVHELTFGGLALYVVGTVMLLANLVKTMRGGRKNAASRHLLVAYAWMVVPVFFAPFVLLAPGLIPAASVEAGAVVGLVNGWILQMLFGALPLVILRLRDPVAGVVSGPSKSGPIPRPILDGAPTKVESGCRLSLVAVNLGVALVWIDALFPKAATSEVTLSVGYGLIAVAMGAFLIRPWKALIHVTSEITSGGRTSGPQGPSQTVDTPAVPS